MRLQDLINAIPPKILFCINAFPLRDLVTYATALYLLSFVDTKTSTAILKGLCWYVLYLDFMSYTQHIINIYSGRFDLPIVDDEIDNINDINKKL